MNQIKIGHFESDGAAVNLDIGFQPDLVLLWAKGASSTNAIPYVWFREMEDHDSIDGWEFPDGIDAEITSGSGITAYDTGTEAPTVTRWATGQSATQRTATARGTLYKATKSGVDAAGNAIDESAIFECVTTGTTDGSNEPVWPTVIGENGPSDNGVIWKKVNISLLRSGYKGFSLAASMTGLASGDEGYFIAIGADSVEDYGDVVGWPGGVRGG